MKVVKQFSVMLPNKRGQLAGLCAKLAAAKVNIVAVSVAETAEQGVVRLVVDKPAAVKRVVKRAKLGCVTTDVLLVDLVNKPGALAVVSKRLAAAGVNILFVYGSTCKCKDCDCAVAVLAVSDLAKAKKVLG